jgi:hypothetical protein
MRYDFKCEKCDRTWEVGMKVEDFREIKDQGLSCECGGNAFNVFNPSKVEVCYVGFQWADKNFKEKEYRTQRSGYLAKRQREVNKVPTLAPNYKGEKTASWKEAQDLARSEGKISETYDHLVTKEKQGKV